MIKTKCKKLNMSQTFLEDGKVVPFTWLEVLDSTEFTKGEKVTISGISKGKGFQGAIKRHNFSTQPSTRGQSVQVRAPGSIGSTTTVARVLKGKKMPGRMGNDKVTIKNRKIILVEDKKIAVLGPVPGSYNSKVFLEKQTHQNEA